MVTNFSELCLVLEKDDRPAWHPLTKEKQVTGRYCNTSGTVVPKDVQLIHCQRPPNVLHMWRLRLNAEAVHDGHQVHPV